MRMLVWLVGVSVNLLGFELSYAMAPVWRWSWWLWLVVWFLAGVGLVISGLVRAVGQYRSRPNPAAVSARAVAIAPSDKGE
jgi:hypothetical protein